MNTVECYETGAMTQVPGSFDELSPGQFDFIMENALLLESNRISQSDFNVKVLYNLMGLEYTALICQKEKRMTKEDLENKHCNIAQLCDQLLGFIFENKRNKTGAKKLKKFAFKSIKNPIPKINLNDVALFGPEDALTNITFAEYRYACDQYRTFSKSKNDQCREFNSHQ